jgi:hypothetical protein
MLLVWLPIDALAQTDKFEMVVEKADGTELTFRITDDYPVLEYQYGGENGVNMIGIRAADSYTSVPCPDIKRIITRVVVDVDPVQEDDVVSFKDEINEDTDLSDKVVDNTYYNMDASNGDGYNAEEQALVLNSTTSAEQMAAIQNAKVGDAAVKENYNGIIFKLASGRGTIAVDVQTIGTHILMVQIGKNAPTKVTKSERGMVDVPYNVAEPTYVYLYASTEDGSAARLDRASSVGDNSVLLYGYKVTIGPDFIPGDVNGDGLVNVTDIVSTVNYIMEKPADSFNKDAADLNGDGVVNVTDIVMMVSIIMSGDN